MASIKSKNTGPERLVFAYLRKQGIYFQKHYKKVPGSPDIALPRKKKAVLIHGDFWHGKTLEKLILKKGSEDFWAVKIASNVKRDALQETQLAEMGWKLLVVWESDLKRKATQAETLIRIEEFLLNG